MTIEQMISPTLADRLRMMNNPNMIPAKMESPDKDLSVDLQWVNYHIGYINDILRVFKLTLGRAAQESPLFFVPNSIVAMAAYSGDKTAHEFNLGWHINVSAWRVPSLFIESRSVQHVKDQLAIDKGINPGSLEMVDILSEVIYRDHTRIREMADLCISSTDVKNIDNCDVYGSSDWLGDGRELTLIRDYRTVKLGASNKNHPYHQPVLINKKVYYGIPLMPVGLADELTDMFEGDLTFGKAPWSYLQ